jgi:O-antigen ligase
LDKLGTWLLCAAVFLAPWASVGIVHALTGRVLGTGVQPAYLPLLALILLQLLFLSRSPRLESGEMIVVLALFWMAAAASLTWSLTDMGLAGDRPWTKSLKQLVQWIFFVFAALACARSLRPRSLPAVERALASGLLLSCLVAVFLAIGGPVPVAPAWTAFLDTNPSIASGSDELYLGHSFTGISRLRGPMPEPLMFGSYLLASVPLVALAGFARQGFARWWRLSTALLGAACLLGTWSRGAWLGAACVLVLFVGLWLRGWFGPVARGRAVIVLAAATLGGLLAFSVLMQIMPWEVPDLLIRRLGQSLAGHDMSNMTRVWSWRVAVDMFRDAPLYGQGWGSYGFRFFHYASDAASGAHFGWPVPNNLGLLLLAETGLIGLLLWAGALVPALAGLRNRKQGVLPVFLGCALVGVLVQLGTFSQWNLPHLWLLFGAGLGVSRWSRAESGVS